MTYIYTLWTLVKTINLLRCGLLLTFNVLEASGVIFCPERVMLTLWYPTKTIISFIC